MSFGFSLQAAVSEIRTDFPNLAIGQKLLEVADICSFYPGGGGGQIVVIFAIQAAVSDIVVDFKIIHILA